MKGYFCFNRIFAGVCCLLLIVTLFFACSKNNGDVANTNVSDNQTFGASADQATVALLYNDLFSMALEVAADNQLAETGRKSSTLHSRLGNCFSVTVTNAGGDKWPKTILLEFTSNCADDDGRTRSGNVQIIMDGYFYYPNAKITISPLTYTVDGIALTGTETITNISTNETYMYKKVVSGASVKMDTVTVSYGGVATIRQTAGAATPANVYDDIFSFTGTDSLSYPGGGVAYITVSDSSALEKQMSCPYIGKGKALVTYNALTATVDYGNGICDDSATVSLGDKIKTIRFPL